MDLINKWREEDAGMLKPNVDAALEASSGLDTAKILKAKQLSVELEQPEATVLANLDYAEQKNTAKRIEAYPRLAEWATEDTKNTAVLRDNLQAFESIARLAAAGEAYKSIELPRPEPKPMDISKVSGLVQRPDGTFVRHSDSYNAHEASKQVTGDWNPDTMSETDMRLLGNRLGPYSSTNVYLSENTLDTIALAGNDFVAAYKEGSGATAFFDGLGAFANSISTDIEAMGTSAKKAWHEGKEQLGDIEVGKSIFALDFEGANAAIERNNQARVSFEGELISPTIEESVGAGVTSIARDIELAPEKAAVTAGATALGALTGRAVGQTVRGAKIGASAGYLSMSFKNSLLLETGSTYASFKGELDENGQPIPDDVAAAASALYGLIAAGIETGADAFFLKVIGLSGLTDKAGALAGKQEAKALMLAYAKNPANKTFLAGLAEKLLKAGGLEAIEEGEQEAVQVMTEYITKEYLNASGFNFSNNMSFDEIAPRITKSMKSGFWGGAGSGGGLVTITHAADYAAGKKLQQRMENASTINAEMNGENMQSVPADLKEAALNRLGLDGNYHVAADELNELYQSGVDVVTPLGLTAEELQDLAVKGLSIALPEAKVLAMNQEQFEALRPLVRETSGGKSAAEYFQQENNLAEAVAETARVQEAAFAERTEFEGKLASLAGEVTQAVENNPNLKAQLEARGETVQAYVENYTELLRGFSERMASAGVPLGQTVDRVKIFSPTELLASWKRKSTIDGVGIMYKRFGDMSRWSEAEKASAIDEVVEEGLFSRSYAEEAVATLSSEDALNQYIIDEENRAFLNEQYQRPDWLKHIWGRLDGKSLKETWPQAYKEISRSVGQGVFRTKAKGGVAIDELADELKSLNMLPRDAGADELVEMLKGHENKNPRYGKEFFQSAEQAGTRNTTDDNSDPRILYQALNPDVDLDQKVKVVRVEPKYTDKKAWELIKGEERKKLKKLAGTYKNIEQGWDIQLTGQGIEHALHSASSRGLSKEGFGLEHIEAVASLPALIEHAVLIESHEDTKEAGLKQVHRMYAPMQIGQDVFTVKLTVKEHSGAYLVEIDGVKKLYDLNLEKKIPDAIMGQPGNYFNEQVVGLAQGISEITIRTLLEDVKDSQGQEFFQGYAGSMSSMADGGYLIKLFNKANLSTLLHETGHVFLAEMKLAVTSGIADKAMIEDYGKLQAWLASAEKPGELEKQYARYAKAQFGGKEFKDLGRADKELARQIIREEYFARGFEAYLLEGKAPAPELQSAFARFAAWLKAVYRNAKQLNVELTDEVRGVFDRLLTADAKVEQAALESELVAFSPEQAKAMGVAEKDLGALNELFAKAKNSAVRIMTDDLLKRKKELTKKWEQEAQERLDADPVYELRKDLHRKGGQIDEFGLVDIVGEDAVKKLRKTLGPGAIGWGQAPEIVAAKHGFNSVNDMVAALLSTPSASKAIKEHVAEKQAEYDATFKAENYLLEAPEIAEMLKAAGEYIKTALGQDKGIDIDYQAIAANHLQKLTVSQASSQLQFVGALRRAIKKERSALLKDDLKAALLANRQARLNLELIKQSAAFKKETEKNEKRAKAFLDNKSAENDAKYVAMSLGARYGLTKPVEKIARGRDANTISAWFKRADDAGYTLLISPEMLNGDSFKPWRTMKVSDYDELVSALTQVRVVEKNLREIELHGKKVALEEAVEEAVDSIHTYRKPKETTAFDSESFIAGGLKTIHAAHTKIEALCLTLDGNNPLGKVWNLIYKPINDAENKRVGLRADLTEALTPVYDLYTMKEWQKISKQKVWVPELNRAIRKSEMIAIALNVGNEGNYIRLREGHGISDEQITAVLNLLDKRDLMFVQGIWDTFSRYKQAAFDLEQRMMGIRPVEVQARPVVTKFGVLRGGYYPVMYDQSKLTIDTEDKIIASRTPAATMTKHGHLKERAKYGAGTALKLDISIIPRAFDQVLTDIAFREAVVSVAKVLRCNDFRAAIESTVGNEQYRAMVAWLRDVANENQHDRVPLENFFGWARVAATTMAMGLKLTTAIAQPFGLSQSIHMLGAKNVAQGIKAAFGNPAKTMELSSWVKSKSAFMADRLNAFDRDIFDSTRWFGQEALTPTSLLDSFTHALMLRGERFLKKNAFILTSLMQYGVDLPTWIAAYDKGLKDFSGSEAKAVDYADSVVRLSQGSGYTKDLARIQRGANAYKMFTMFYSYFSTVYNLTANVVADVNMKRDAASVLAAGNAFLLLYVIPAILSEIAAGRGPDEDDGEEPLSWAVQQVIMYPMQTVVGVRTFANVVEAEFGYKFTPAQDAPASLYNLFKEMNKLAFDEDYDADGKKLAKTALRAYGFAKGLPLQQPIISAFNIMDYFDGTAPNFEVRDLVFTRQKSRR